MTNDGATILKALYVDNPAAKVLVGTTFGFFLSIIFSSSRSYPIGLQVAKLKSFSSLLRPMLDRKAHDEWVEVSRALFVADISRVQDDEVGDGTTSVVVLAGELLREAEKLVNQKIHPMTIISGIFHVLGNLSVSMQRYLALLLQCSN